VLEAGPQDTAVGSAGGAGSEGQGTPFPVSSEGAGEPGADVDGDVRAAGGPELVIDLGQVEQGQDRHVGTVARHAGTAPVPRWRGPRVYGPAL